MVVLDVIAVVWHNQSFDAMGFGTGMGAIVGGSGLASWGYSRASSIMAQIGSGQGIQGG